MKVTIVDPDADLRFMRRAIELATNCVSEEGKTSPRVGAVVVKDGKELAAAYRGERGDQHAGEHAEFVALRIKLSDVDLADATVYTTLEPCTYRSPEKTPCTDWIIQRKIGRVVIGMLDPNPNIHGVGMFKLRRHQIEVDTFPDDLTQEIEALNKEFIRAQRPNALLEPVDAEFIQARSSRSLDDWYKILNQVYWNKNYDRDPTAILCHMSETIGSLSLLASSKKKPSVDPERYIIKTIAWWLALCGKLGVTSVEKLIWGKFPAVCAYCHERPHNPNECTERKASYPGPRWEKLADIGDTQSRPTTLGGWQVMFSEIYPVQQTEDFGLSFGRLTEEMGELAEAVRVFRAYPGYFLSESADVFAWLMHIQNLIESKKSVKNADRGVALTEAMIKAYPDRCLECRGEICVCPPLLPSTIGRIGHEVPPTRQAYGTDGQFMTPDQASEFFRKQPDFR